MTAQRHVCVSEHVKGVDKQLSPEECMSVCVCVCRRILQKPVLRLSHCSINVVGMWIDLLLVVTVRSVIDIRD